MKAIDELVQQIHKDWGDAVEERVKANTQDGWQYAEAKAVISKAHWGEAVEVQKQLQAIESYIEEQVEAHKPDEDDIQNEFWALDNTGAGRYQAYSDILKKIRG